jgi:hypothetical protein
VGSEEEREEKRARKSLGGLNEKMIDDPRQRQKRISDDESPKDAIRSPDPVSEGDSVAQGGPLPPKAKPPEELLKLRAALIAYMGKIPPAYFENSCMLRARGATAADIIDLINRRLDQSAVEGKEISTWAPSRSAYLELVFGSNRKRILARPLARACCAAPPEQQSFGRRDRAWHRGH